MTATTSNILDDLHSVTIRAARGESWTVAAIDELVYRDPVGVFVAACAYAGGLLRELLALRPGESRTVQDLMLDYFYECDYLYDGEVDPVVAAGAMAHVIAASRSEMLNPADYELDEPAVARCALWVIGRCAIGLASDLLDDDEDHSELVMAARRRAADSCG